MEVDFSDLRERIGNLKDVLYQLATDSSELDELVIWNNFLKRISYKVYAFCRDKNGSFAPDAGRDARYG
jgi:hypothetical protein